jgi:hypothetical protein
MQDRAIRKVLLIQAIEETDRSGEALPLAERTEATRAAIGNNPPAVETQAQAPLSSATEWFLARRAEVLLRSLRVRSPGIDHVLEVAGGATSLDRGLLVVAFIAGILLSLLDGGSGINIFAPALVLLVIWNLLVYVWLLGPGRRRRAVRTGLAGSAAQPGSTPRAGSAPATVAGASSCPVDTDVPSARSWFGTFYARWVRARMDRLLGHSTRFNAPLTPGLRRFAGDWWDIAQPLFQARARRLLHLAAALAALGLIAAYYFRGFILRSAAGWEGGGAIGPETAHVLLTVLYGPASVLSGIRIPAAEDIAKLRWSAPSLAGVGEPASWVHLIALTACLYIIVPRLIIAAFSTLSLWRLRSRLTLPSPVATYVRTLFASAR